jgi:hypothetical protein
MWNSGTYHPLQDSLTLKIQAKCKNKPVIFRTITYFFIIYIILDQRESAQAKTQGQFIDARKISPLLRGTKPIYTGDFNELVNENASNANFLTRRLFAGLLALEQDRDLGHNLFPNLKSTQLAGKFKRSPKKSLSDFNAIINEINSNLTPKTFTSGKKIRWWK